MLVQTQTTIRILIVAVAGLATVALARPGPATQAHEAVAIPNLEAGSRPGSIARRHGSTAGFAVFCEDRR